MFCVVLVVFISVFYYNANQKRKDLAEVLLFDKFPKKVNIESFEKEDFFEYKITAEISYSDPQLLDVILSQRAFTKKNILNSPFISSKPISLHTWSSGQKWLEIYELKPDKDNGKYRLGLVYVSNAL